MKKILMLGAIGLSLTALTAFTQVKSNQKTVEQINDCTYGQCSKIKADGYQCKNCAQKGSYYCWSHK